MDARAGDSDRSDARSTVVVIQPRFVVQAVVWCVLGLLALVVLDRSAHVLQLVLAAIVIAVVLRAPIEALSRNLPRWAAIAAVVLGSIGALAALLALGTIELRREIGAVGDAIERRIDRIDPDSAVGRFLTDVDAADRIAAHLDRIPSQILIGGGDAAEGARLGLEALLVVVLIVYALVNGPRLARAVLGGGDSPRWWADDVRAGVDAGAAQVRRLLVLAAASGVVGWGVAHAFGLPGANVLAIWVGVWAVVPIFGPVIGYAPLAVLASLDGWPQTIGVVLIAGAVAAGSWYAERFTAARTGTRGTPGPLGLAVALVIGLRFNWIVGPLVAIFVVATAIATLAALGRRDRSRVLGDQPVPAEGEPGRRNVWGRLDLRSAARAAAIVVVAVALIVFVIDLAPAPVWVIVGITLAIALDPLVGWIAEHSPLGRNPSIAVVIVATLALVAVMLGFGVPSVVSSARDLDDQLPTIAADLEELPLIGGELAERGVADRLETTIGELPTRLASESGPLEGALRSVGDGLVATFWVLLITVAALVDGERSRRGLRAVVAPDRTARFDRIDTIVRRVIARYAVGSVVIAALAGAAAFTIAVVAGVPLAPLVGLWVAVTNFIPQIGGYLGAAPLVLLGFTTGTTRGLVIMAVYLLYMQIENRVIQPVIVSKAVDIAPLVAMVAVLVGGAAAGVVGAVLATPLVAVAIALRDELGSPDREG